MYFLQNDWLFNKQYGFRAKNAKDHAVIEFVINIYNSSNQMNFIIVVFIDLSKAFDNVKYQILSISGVGDSFGTKLFGY